MSFRPLTYLSNIRSFTNSPLKFLFAARGPKCPPGEFDVPVEKPTRPVYEDTGPMTPLKRKQIQFQEDNGLPVHLKGGPMDRVLMSLTFVLAGVGLLQTGKLFVDLIGGPTNEVPVISEENIEATED